LGTTEGSKVDTEKFRNEIDSFINEYKNDIDEELLKTLQNAKKASRPEYFTKLGEKLEG